MKRHTRFRKSLLALSIVLLGAFALPAWAKDSWDSDKRYALIVGINDYQSDAVVDLKCANSVAKLFKETLVKDANFPEDNIFLLSSDNKGESDQPTLTNIVFRLEWLRDVVNPGDTLVFYFAGHGVSMDSETFLLTEDADQRSKNTLMVSSLPGTVLNNLLKAAGAQNTLVLLDACRNDPTAGSRGQADNALTDAMSRGLVFKPAPAAAPELPRNTATIFACDEGQRSWEWGDKNQGFFTYFLAEGLNKGAYDAQGNATLQGLVNYVSTKVNATAMRETNHPQKPMVRYEGPGADHWVLAHSLAGNPNPAEGRLAKLDRAQLVAELQAKEFEKRNSPDEEALSAERDKSYIIKCKLGVETSKNALLEAERGGDKNAEENAKKALATAQAELAVAEAIPGATYQSIQANKWSQNEAVARVETAKIAKEVYFGSQAGSPEMAALEKKLVELQAQLDLLQVEKKKAVTDAAIARKKVRQLLHNPVFADKDRVGRSTRQGDLWWIDYGPVQEQSDDDFK